MQCPDCRSTHIRKHRHRKEKQNHICTDCRRQFINDYQSYQGYSDEVRRECLKMYVNGMGFRGIEREIAGGIIPPATLSRVKGVHHTTVISWVKAVGELLPDADNPDQIPEVGELDKRFWEELFPPKLSHELETFVRSKKLKSGCGRQ